MSRDTILLSSLSPEKIMEDICRNPWDHYIPPFQIAPKVFYVSGNDWVGSYLIESKEGLVLIDTAMHESCYLLLESIRSLGYDYKNIKKILLSHAHIDHIGAARTLQELTGAQIYIGKRDLELLTVRKDLIFGNKYTCGELDIDKLKIYEEEKIIVLGDVKIETYPTPGHTPGCTSFVFEREDENGKKYKCAMHGGIGLNTINRKFLEEKGLPKTLQIEFLEQFIEMKKLNIDICIPSHTNQIKILQLIPKDRKDYSPFVNKNNWQNLMKERIEKVKQLIKNND